MTDPTTKAIERNNNERDRLTAENLELLGLLREASAYIDTYGGDTPLRKKLEIKLKSYDPLPHERIARMASAARLAVLAQAEGATARVAANLRDVEEQADALQRIVRELLDTRGAPARCEVTDCRKQVSHAEHHYARIRFWCEDHVPMSGHHEWCPEPCTHLVAKYVTPSPSMLGRGEIG